MIWYSVVFPLGCKVTCSINWLRVDHRLAGASQRGSLLSKTVSQDQMELAQFHTMV